MTEEQSAMIAALFKENGKRLSQLAYRHTGNIELAEDLVQETMLIACMKAETLLNHENQKGWLARTIWNLATREMSKAYHTELPLELDYIDGSASIDLPMEFYIPPGLSDSYREMILMRIDREMTYAEIAEAKGITEDAARQQVSRAIRKCRELATDADNATSV